MSSVISRLASSRQLESAALDGLNEGQLRAVLRHVAHRDDGIGAVGERQAQDAGIRAEGGQRLLRAENGEKVGPLHTVDRGAGLDVSLRLGEKDGPAVAERALGQARGERALPIGVRAEALVLEAERGEVGR